MLVKVSSRIARQRLVYSLRPRTLDMGDDDPRLRWRWFHGFPRRDKTAFRFT
jgi:hypothetical protein